jgi:hypothetical protein
MIVIDKVLEINISRLKAFNANSKAGGFRVFRLAPSAFDAPPARDEEQDLFKISSLRFNRTKQELAHEILLHLGIPLGANIQTVKLDESEFWVSEGVLMQIQGESTLELIELAKEYECGVLAVLEDELAGKDSIKANLFFACKKANISLKTF